MTTFDGKQYVIPGKCTYMASQVHFPTALIYNIHQPTLSFCDTDSSFIFNSPFKGLNWTITIQFSEREVTLKTVVLQLFQVQTVFS